MPNTRDIRRRIKSIKNTSQITKAMQMVAASKMRKAQQAALAGRPFAEALNRIMVSARGRVNLDAHPLMERREEKNVCVLLITTDKGLCGALNTNLLRLISQYDAATTSFVSVGRKGRAFLVRNKRTLLADFEVGDAFTYANTRAIGKFLIDLYTEQKVDRVDVLYTNFVNTLVQKPEKVPLLPISPDALLSADLADSDQQADAKTQSEAALGTYEFEPDENEVLNAVLPGYVYYQVWHYQLESKASEHSSRMVAMKSATDNAKQMIKDLTLEYNKIRQAGITNELLEITTAQMALS
ncbi:MAG: ATP synthase F1 subunit gamma [Verrucomicrobiae bacterium]|nr:ATP synthase F1 subunit gamma [Verrucomicrobiae bacterium]